MTLRMPTFLVPRASAIAAALCTLLLAGPALAQAPDIVIADFEGSSVALTLNDSGSNQFTVVLDGVLQATLKTTAGTSTYALDAALGAGAEDDHVLHAFQGDCGRKHELLVAPSAPVSRDRDLAYCEIPM